MYGLRNALCVNIAVCTYMAVVFSPRRLVSNVVKFSALHKPRREPLSCSATVSELENDLSEKSLTLPGGDDQNHGSIHFIVMLDPTCRGTMTR